jgi:molybdenum cofactor cytidylyltransferase
MKIVGIILAAGEGKRASGSKLSKCIAGKPMLQWVVETAVASKLKGSIIVTGKEREFAENLAKLYGLDAVHNPDYRLGMSSSIKKGVRSLPEDVDGFAIILGDMPFIRVETVDMLISEFLGWPGIVVPVFRGQRGHPPIFSSAYRDKIASLEGDEGARSIIDGSIERVKFVNVGDSAVIQDIDCL